MMKHTSEMTKLNRITDHGSTRLTDRWALRVDLLALTVVAGPFGAIIDTPLCSAFAFAGDVLADESLLSTDSLPEAVPAEPLDPRGVLCVPEPPSELLPVLLAEEPAGADAEAADDPAGFAVPLFEPEPEPAPVPVPEAVDGLPIAEPARVAELAAGEEADPADEDDMLELCPEEAEPVEAEPDPEPVADLSAESAEALTADVSPDVFVDLSAAAPPDPVPGFAAPPLTASALSEPCPAEGESLAAAFAL